MVGVLGGAAESIFCNKNIKKSNGQGSDEEKRTGREMTVEK
jgi:hypothetical protein